MKYQLNGYTIKVTRGDINVNLNACLFEGFYSELFTPSKVPQLLREAAKQLELKDEKS